MNPPTSHPTILVAAAPTLYRTGLISILNQQWPGLDIILTADTGQVLELVRIQSIQLLILDDHLLGRTLPAFLHCLRHAQPTQKTVLLIADNQTMPVSISSQVVIPRHTTPNSLAAAIAPLVNATSYQNTPSRTLHPIPTHFSSRELEVLRLVADDHCNQAIADQLYLSVRTVESHRRALLQKSGSRTLAGLVAWALRLGMVA